MKQDFFSPFTGQMFDGNVLWPFLVLWIGLSCVCPAIGLSEPADKAVYGADNRQDYYQVTSTLQTLSESVALVVKKSFLQSNAEGYTFTSTLDIDHIGFCDGQAFLQQRAPFRAGIGGGVGGFATAFIVAQDLVATAASSVIGRATSDYAFVFGFRMNSATETVLAFSNDDVYFPQRIVEQNTGDADWAVVRLDREVVGRPPLPVRTTEKIPDGASVLVMGYPLSIPIKIAGGAAVRTNSHPDYFVANLDASEECAGAPVFNLDTLMVEGILARPQDGIVAGNGGGCFIWVTCPDDGCAGDEVVRAPLWAHVIGGGDTPTPAPTLTPTPDLSTPTRTGTPTPTPLPPDDHGNEANTATALVIGVTATGVINFMIDPDWFSFPVQTDQIYSIEVRLNGLGASALNLFGTDGITSYGDSEDIGQDGAYLALQTSMAGTYFARVMADLPNSSKLGGYSIVVRTVTDPHGDDFEGASPVPLNSTTVAGIDYIEDIDVFRFAAREGGVYKIQVTPPPNQMSEATVYNITGEFQIADKDFIDYGTDLLWLAPEDGDYYLKVEAFFSFDEIFPYNLRITEYCTPGGAPSSGFLPTDLNRDGRVDEQDLALFASDFAEVQRKGLEIWRRP